MSKSRLAIVIGLLVLAACQAPNPLDGTLGLDANGQPAVSYQCCGGWDSNGDVQYCYLGPNLQTAANNPQPYPWQVSSNGGPGPALTAQTQMCQQSTLASKTTFVQTLSCGDVLYEPCQFGGAAGTTVSATSQLQCQAIGEDTLSSGNCVCSHNNNQPCPVGSLCTLSGCKPMYGRYAFITNASHSAKLVGGGADSACQAEAQFDSGQVPSGTYRAMLAGSDGKYSSLYDVVSSIVGGYPFYNVALPSIYVYDAVTKKVLTAPLSSDIAFGSTCANGLPLLDCINGVNTDGKRTNRLGGGHGYFWTGSPNGSFFSPSTPDSTCSLWSATSGGTPGIGNDGDPNWRGYNGGDCNGSNPLLCLQASPISLPANVTKIPVLQALRGGTRAEGLNGGEYIISANGKHRLKMETNGDLVLSTISKADSPGDFSNAESVWHSNSQERCQVLGGDCYFNFQNDGNFCVYSSKQPIVTNYAWCYRTSGEAQPNARLVLQNDGRLVLYSNRYYTSEIWSSSANVQPVPLDSNCCVLKASTVQPGTDYCILGPGDGPQDCATQTTNSAWRTPVSCGEHAWADTALTCATP